MRINDDHLYHGAALTQIAEFPTFKAINAFSANGEKSRSAFIVNHDTGIYLKYATSPTKRWKEYVFTFTETHLAELEALKSHHARVFIVLVCRKAKEICVLTLDEFEKHRALREKAKGAKEPHYQILVTVPKGKSFRVYMNAPGQKKTMLKDQKVPRSDFPKLIFETGS
jgi:hypothetical protein